MICKGFLFFIQGDYDNSEMYFNNISESEKNTNLNKNIIILSKIGRALNSYNKANYNKAIENFASLIKEYDYVNENVLESLGICYYNINKINKARKIFLKIIELNPNNPKVNTYLYVINIENEKFDNIKLEKGFELLANAYLIEGGDDFHFLLLKLGNYFLATKKIKEAEEIAQKLLNLLEKGEMKSIRIDNSSRPHKEKYRKDIEEIRSHILCFNAKINHLKVIRLTN
jgi:tetratricopeptide (TPR) repeat protein